METGNSKRQNGLLKATDTVSSLDSRNMTSDTIIMRSM